MSEPVRAHIGTWISSTSLSVSRSSSSSFSSSFSLRCSVVSEKLLETMATLTAACSAVEAASSTAGVRFGRFTTGADGEGGLLSAAGWAGSSSMTVGSSPWSLRRRSTSKTLTSVGRLR